MSTGLSEEDWLELVQEGRRLACEGRFRGTLRRRKAVFRAAA